MAINAVFLKERTFVGELRCWRRQDLIAVNTLACKQDAKQREPRWPSLQVGEDNSLWHSRHYNSQYHSPFKANSALRLVCNRTLALISELLALFSISRTEFKLDSLSPDRLLPERPGEFLDGWEAFRCEQPTALEFHHFRKTHCLFHNLNATALHVMGINHTR